MNTLAACLLLLPQALQAAHFSATVLHTNDVHGRFEQVTPSGTRCTKQASEAYQCVGGIARQKTLVMRATASGANVLFLNSGDYYQGSIWYYFLGAQIVVDAVNYLAHDAMTLGNHEFDHGADGLAPLLTGSQVPILGCNVDFSDEPKLRHLQPRAALTVERAGTKIGLIGYLTPNTTFLSNPGGLVSGDKPQGPYPIVVDRVSGSRCLVVQDFYMGKYMGNISVTWDDRGEVVQWSGQPTLLDSSVPEDSAGVALLDRYRDRVAQGRAMGVAESKVYLQGDKPTCRLAECNLGNLIMDAFLKKMASLPSPRGAWTSVAAVIANAGGIRASIDEQSTGGLVTFEDVVNVLPFGNTLVVMNVSGAQLRNLLEHGVHRHDAKGEVAPAEFLITAGLRVVYDVRRKPYERVVDAFILCADCRVPRFEPLEDARRYRVAAMSYIVRGGDNFNFSFVAPSDMYDTGFEDAQIVVSHMNATSPLTTAVDGRVIFLKLPTGQTSASDGRSAPALASHIACLLLFVFFTCSMTFSAI
ncbi:protein 5NUC-like isoform X2 [Dermacentor variabilis]|uniref:protein 5NUC-like isoform X2 n=1 Tax=Dermacentor variabilis TaxID=34621 RepID=UPI003F5B0754